MHGTAIKRAFLYAIVNTSKTSVLTYIKNLKGGRIVKRDLIKAVKGVRK